jgi:flagellin FlaB
MYKKRKHMLGDERGITGLETAIILIAFVVVAAVFSFAVLSAGTYSTERSKEAVYSGISEVQSTMELRGGIIAKSDDNTYVKEVIFTVANVAGGEAIDLTAPTIESGAVATTSSHRVVIAYIDSNQNVRDMPWAREWVGAADNDALLEEGEMAEITVPLTATATYSNPLTTGLTANSQFKLEVKPGRGATLLIQRTMPAYLDTVMSLN